MNSESINSDQKEYNNNPYNVIDTFLFTVGRVIINKKTDEVTNGRLKNEKNSILLRTIKIENVNFGVNESYLS